MGVPLPADLDIADVARPAVLGGRVQQSDAVEAGKSHARVDGELLKRRDAERSRSPKGRSQSEGGGELHGDLNRVR